MPEASGPLGLGRVFLILRQGGRVVPLSPCALSGGGSSWAHLAMRLRLAHLAGQMWGLSKGVAGSFVFPSPSSQSPGHASQVTPALPRLLWGGKAGTHESHLTPLWGWGGSSVWGVSATPGRREPGQTRRSAFVLALPSCESGRTIWSPLRQPNKPGNAGQALQIPLTAAGCRAEPATRA